MPKHVHTSPCPMSMYAKKIFWMFFTFFLRFFPAAAKLFCIPKLSSEPWDFFDFSYSGQRKTFLCLIEGSFESFKDLRRRHFLPWRFYFFFLLNIFWVFVAKKRGQVFFNNLIFGLLMMLLGEMRGLTWRWRNIVF